MLEWKAARREKPPEKSGGFLLWLELVVLQKLAGGSEIEHGYRSVLAWPSEFPEHESLYLVAAAVSPAGCPASPGAAGQRVVAVARPAG